MSTDTTTPHAHGEPEMTLHSLPEYQPISTCFWMDGDRYGIDAQGRHIEDGKGMDRAHREGAFPVVIYRKEGK